MLRRINFYLICFVFGLSVLILAGNVRNFLKINNTEDDFYLPVPTNLYDGASNVEKILEYTRMKIKLDLSKYNFTYSGVENLLMEAGGKPLRSVIVSTWKSGATLLGEVLNSVPSNFYHYEPLLKYEMIQIRGSPHAEKAIGTIKSMLKCNYQNMDDYFEYGKTHWRQFIHNTRLWDHCKYKKKLCFDTDFTSKFCKLFPFQSMKVLRIRLRLAQELLKDKELNVKVVLVIRDPRGVMQSREYWNVCQAAPDCWKPELLCADMVSDYEAAARLVKEFPDRFRVLRYEELALYPNETTKTVLKWLRISSMAAVDGFLQTPTYGDSGVVSSISRLKRVVPSRWKTILSFEQVVFIQSVCKEAMGLWGYKMAHNETHLASKDFNPF